MATIHSLPAELIRHTLSLAYPPNELGSGAGLCATAVVHSTWLDPSLSVMTEKLHFSFRSASSLERFVESGPAGFASRSVRLSFDGTKHLAAVLGKAKSGGISHLDLAFSEAEALPSRLFQFASLRREVPTK